MPLPLFTTGLTRAVSVRGEAGAVRDAMTIEGVDKEPEIYVLPEVNERREGVANWFSAVGSLDLSAPMEFPEGRWNVRYTLEELSACPEAFEIVRKALKLASGFELSPGAGMWDMMKAMTPETMVKMAGSMVPEGFLESLNGKLTAIARA